MDLQELCMQATRYFEEGHYQEAADLGRRILDQHPDAADIHHLLGRVHIQRGQPAQARPFIQKALECDAANAAYHRSLGDACLMEEVFDAALAAYQKALSLQPDDADTLLRIGNLCNSQGDPTQALTYYKKALAIQPEHIGALFILAEYFYNQLDIESSVKLYDKCLQADPNHAGAHYGRAKSMLLKGDYLKGWTAHEWRLKLDDPYRTYPHKLKGRRWDGSPFGGERLLLHCEESPGDVLHFCRYLPMVKALGGHVLLEVQPPLVPLLQTLPFVDEIIPFDPQNPPAVRYERHFPLMSLPLIMKTTLEKIPANIPYIQADPHKIAPWQKRLMAEGLRVGLAWSESTAIPDAFPPTAWQPLWKSGPIHFYSLQMEDTPQHPTADWSADYPMTHLDREFSDFSDAAAVIANLDLIIGVDSAIVHLAGAMGKPVWVLLPYVPHWRWLTGRGDSPWYPTARLFRQQRSCDDWSPVIAEVAAALEELTAGFGFQGGPDEPADPSAGAKGASRVQAQTCFEEGLQLLRKKEYAPAVKSLQQAITIRPKWAEAHFELARAYHGQGRLSQAIETYRTAIRLDPGMKSAHANLGSAHFQNGDLEEAAACYEQAIGLYDDLAAIFNDLGRVQEAQRKMDAAADCYRSALRINPRHADALYNLGNIHLTLRELDKALTCLTQAVQIDPRHHLALSDLGRTYHLLGLLDQAQECYGQALKIAPDFPEAHLNQALCKLLVGRWNEGWSDYEWRFECQNSRSYYPHELYGERWQGQDLKGRNLLIYGENDPGKTIQMIRYLPSVKERGGRVILEISRPLMGLLSGYQGVDELIEHSPQNPPSLHYHTYAALGSLPGLFKTTPNTVLSDVPYLKADPDRVAKWKKRLPQEGLHVGLLWSGEEGHPERNCTLSDLVPLAFVKGINWIGLQQGPAAIQARTAHLPYNFKVVNWGEEFSDFSDIAAAVECLDLIICIDSPVAHLAGALGKEVWIMLPAVPDWCWLLERSQSPWYPTAHLFRQQRDGEWSRTMPRISASLEQWRKKK